MKTEKTISSLKLFFIAYFAPITTQAEDLSKYFKDEGANVLTGSSVKNVFMRAVDMAYRLVRNHARYDSVIIQSHSYAHFLYTIWILCWVKLLKKKYIIMYLGGAAPQFFKNWGKYIRRVFLSADAVVVGSKFLEGEFAKMGVDVTVIPAVMKRSEWKFKKRTRFLPKLLWVRHLRPEYNPQMAVEVVSCLIKNGINARLTFVGSNEMQKELEIASEKLGARRLIDFSGPVHPGKLQQYYDNNDIFINTTHVDNQPRSILEAQACGLPVISTDVGGCPYIITHGENGYLVGDNDSKTMAEFIVKIVEDAEYANKIVKKALNKLDLYQWMHIKNQWLELLNKIGNH